MKFKPLQIVAMSVVGAAVAGGYTLWRTTDWEQDKLEGFEPKPLNWINNCEDLIPIFRRIKKEFYIYVPVAEQPAWLALVDDSIGAIDQLMCIQVQLEHREIQPTPQDRQDATRWYQIATGNLRNIQQVFVRKMLANNQQQSTIAVEFSKLVADALLIVMRHLNIVYELVRKQQLEQTLQRMEMQFENTSRLYQEQQPSTVQQQ